MTDVFLDMPASVDQRIDELHAWIAIHSSGAESIISADVPMPGNVGTRHLPLLSSKRHVIEKLEALAARVASMDRTVSSVKMITFRKVVD